jgi:hypothetical protein
MVARTDSATSAAISALSEATAQELLVLARGLELAGGTFAPLAPALLSLYGVRGDGGEPGPVDELAMRLALRRVGKLLEQDAAARARLNAAEEPLWVAVREALAGMA